MDFSQVAGYIAIKSTDPWWLALAKVLLYVAAAVLLLIKSVRKIPQGQFAIKRRMGIVVRYRSSRPAHVRGELVVWPKSRRPMSLLGWHPRYQDDRPGHESGEPVIVWPGLSFGFPFGHSWEPTSSQERLFKLDDDLFCPAEAGFYWTQKVYIGFRVVDPYQALVAYQDVEGQVRGLASRVGQQLLNEGVSNTDLKAAFRTHPEVQAASLLFGVVVSTFYVGASALTPPTQLAQAMAAARVDPGGSALIATVTDIVPGVSLVPGAVAS